MTIRRYIQTTNDRVLKCTPNGQTWSQAEYLVSIIGNEEQSGEDWRRQFEVVVGLPAGSLAQVQSRDDVRHAVRRASENSRSIPQVVPFLGCPQRPSHGLAPAPTAPTFPPVPPANPTRMARGPGSLFPMAAAA